MILVSISAPVVDGFGALGSSFRFSLGFRFQCIALVCVIREALAGDVWFKGLGFVGVKAVEVFWVWGLRVQGGGFEATCVVSGRELLTPKPKPWVQRPSCSWLSLSSKN